MTSFSCSVTSNTKGPLMKRVLKVALCLSVLVGFAGFVYNIGVLAFTINVLGC